jgi:hypothetical protein
MIGKLFFIYFLFLALTIPGETSKKKLEKKA